MMKKFDQMKTLELVVFMGFAALCFYQIVIASDIYQQITTDENVMHLCIFLWLSLFLSFACIFVDFSLYSKQNQNIANLAYAANTDSVARIANRYSIDSIIDEYAEKEIPSEMGAAMIELTSLKDVNAQYGRVEGNNLIRSFSIILSMASLDECIVGRNGGNRFIILYEKSSDLHLSVFLDRLADKVRDYNANKNNHPIEYAFGTAYAGEDEITSITRLIALSSMRLTDNINGANAEEEASEEEEDDESYAILDDLFPIEDFIEEPLDLTPAEPPFTKEDIAAIGAQKLQIVDKKRARISLFKRRMAC